MSTVLLKCTLELSTSLYFLFQHPITSCHNLYTQEIAVIPLILCLHYCLTNPNINSCLRNTFETQIKWPFISVIFIAPRISAKPPNIAVIQRTDYLLFLKYFLLLCFKNLQNFRYIDAKEWSCKDKKKIFQITMIRLTPYILTIAIYALFLDSHPSTFVSFRMIYCTIHCFLHAEYWWKSIGACLKVWLYPMSTYLLVMAKIFLLLILILI